MLLVVSTLVTVAGGGLMGVSAVRGGPDHLKSSASELPVAGFAATDEQAAEETGERDALDEWSPTIFRLGFSFFVGFAIAYALRSFMKISLITIGVVLLGLFGLQYAGIVDVNWQAMEAHYDTAAEWLGNQTQSFTAFVQGYLPSAGMAGFGFVTGFRRRR